MSETRRILSITGGGIFGCVPAFLLRNCDLSRVDFFAGTSIGSVLSLMYAAGCSPRYVHDSFSEKAEKIFHLPFLRRLYHFRAKYSDTNLNQELKEHLEVPFGVLRPCFVPSYHYPMRKTKVFDNIAGDDDAIAAWEVARASAAAPTYFTPWNGYIDGGWWANDPSLAAALGVEYKTGIDRSRLRVLVVGTGRNAADPEYEKRIESWNRWQWLGPAIERVTVSNEQATEWCCARLGLSFYKVFNPCVRPKGSLMDQTFVIPAMLSQAEAVEEMFNETWNAFLED